MNLEEVLQCGQKRTVYDSYNHLVNFVNADVQR